MGKMGGVCVYLYASCNSGDLGGSTIIAPAQKSNSENFAHPKGVVSNIYRGSVARANISSKKPDRDRSQRETPNGHAPFSHSLHSNFFYCFNV